LYLSYYSLHLY